MATEGMEKRGVIAKGWTPPSDCRVVSTPGKTCLENRQTAAGKQAAVDDLDDDMAKRLAKAVEKAIKDK